MLWLHSENWPPTSAKVTKFYMGLYNRAPQLKINFHGSGDGGKASQNYPLRLGPRSFGSKLMDLDMPQGQQFSTEDLDIE